MSADLHIHTLTKDFTEEHYKQLKSHTLGSKYFNPNVQVDYKLYKLCGNTPQVWVGEVSWLKASLFDDAETYVPSTIEKIHEIIGEDFPLIDDELISKIKSALLLPNKTNYSIDSGKSVLEFLEKHKNEKAFCISW